MNRVVVFIFRALIRHPNAVAAIALRDLAAIPNILRPQQPEAYDVTTDVRAYSLMILMVHALSRLMALSR